VPCCCTLQAVCCLSYVASRMLHVALHGVHHMLDAARYLLPLARCRLHLVRCLFFVASRPLHAALLRLVVGFTFAPVSCPLLRGMLIHASSWHAHTRIQLACFPQLIRGPVVPAPTSSTVNRPAPVAAQARPPLVQQTTSKWHATGEWHRQPARRRLQHCNMPQATCNMQGATDDLQNNMQLTRDTGDRRPSPEAI
jgi:hypothetical protein